MLLLVGLTTLVVGVIEVPDLGAPALAPIACGLLALGLFVRHERTCAHPLIEFRLLGNRMVATSLAALFAIQFAVSITTGRFADRHGPRALVLPGLMLATASLAGIGLLAPSGSVVALLPGLLVFALARPMVFTPAGIGPFLALDGDRSAFAASMATEARQLGAVLGVALTALAHGSAPTGGSPAPAGGFAAAALSAAAVCAAAMLLVWRRMPGRAR
ncbi:MAG: hypothetical protein L0I76_36595 [Pseudonocardia sp.]|nr:hypothetical protein [Pseudonocardia sp.]